MGTRSKTLVVGMLAVSIATGSILFGFTQKAEAGTSDCLAGILAGKLKGAAARLKTAASSIGMNVPVNSKAANAKIDANSKIASDTSGNTQGSVVQRCIVEPLVTTMARVALNKFTAQTVKWINSGFKGSPLYVTNPQGFLTDIADQSLGQFINGLGEIGQILCSPFDFQLRLSLNLQYSAPQFYEEIGCRLTDIQQNVQRAFTGGSFGKNGWDNWLQLTAQPQNNPYGAYIKAVNSLDTRIATRQNAQSKQLDWGKGFLSSQRCAEEVMNQSTGEMECLRTEIETPGSLIEDQLSKTLGQKVANVGLAKDIDAIIGALINQMINQVMGGVGGLLGASRPSGGQTPRGGGQALSGGGQSMVDRGNNTTVANVLNDINQSQNLPDGLYVRSAVGEIGPTATDADGKPTGPTPTAFCTAFKGNIYSADKGTDNTLKNTSPVYVKIGGVGADVATKKTGTPSYWTLADYNNVALYCENVQITAPIGQATRNFNDQTGGSENLPDENIPDVISPNNLALNKPVKQSSTYTGWSYYPEAKIAVDGQTTGSSDYGLALTQNNADEWWQVELASTSQNISAVKIYRMANGDYLNYPFYVFVTTEDMGEATTNDMLTDNSGKVVRKIPVDAAAAFGNKGSNVASFAINGAGRYVRISKYYGRTHLGLAEVEVIPAGGTVDATAAVTPPLSFSRSKSDETSLSRHETFSDEVVLIAGKDLNGLKARVKLANNNFQVQQFPVYFNMFKITMGLSGGDETADIVVTAPGCFVRYSQCATINPALGAVYGGVITLNDSAFSMKTGNSVKINLTGTASEFAWGSQKVVLEIIDAAGAVLATYEKVLSLGK